MARVFVSVGSNVDRERHIALALELLRAHFGELQLSSVYESAAVGFDGDPFFNLVVAFETDAEPRQIVTALHEMERRCGRPRGGTQFSPRTMDLDLLLAGDLVMRDEKSCFRARRSALRLLSCVRWRRSPVSAGTR